MRRLLAGPALCSRKINRKKKIIIKKNYLGRVANHRASSWGPKVATSQRGGVRLGWSWRGEWKDPLVKYD